MATFNFDILCYALSLVSSSTVRVYHKEQLLFSHSILDYLKDPIDAYLEEILSSSDEYGVYCSPLFQLFGYFTLKNGYRFVIGPTCILVNDSNGIDSLMFLLDIPPSFKKEYLSQLQFGNHISAERLENIVLFFLYLIDRRPIDASMLQRLAGSEIKNDVALENMIHLETKIDVGVLQDNAEKGRRFEQIITSLIREGQPEKIVKMFHSIPNLAPGEVAFDTLRQSKNIGICSATVASRAAIDGGLDCTTAFRLSDLYIQKIELSKDSTSIISLSSDMFFDFASRVRDIRYGVKHVSNIFYLCTQYISKNMTSPIKVEDIAKELHLSRSYLSTCFKKQSGISLTSYILNAKILESQRLLLHTKRSINDIALYLSFSSQSHFQNSFKKFTATTPNEYRKHRGMKSSQ